MSFECERFPAFNRFLRGGCWFLLDILAWLLSFLLTLSTRLLFILCSLATRLLSNLLALSTPHNTDKQQADKQSFHGSTFSSQ